MNKQIDNSINKWIKDQPSFRRNRYQGIKLFKSHRQLDN